jgi:hypothetical protein
MQYWLSYNENIGFYRIDEVGKTLMSQDDDADYKKIGGSDNLQELKDFVEKMTLIHLSIDLINWQIHHNLTFDAVLSCFNKRFDNLIIRVCERSSFVLD